MKSTAPGHIWSWLFGHYQQKYVWMKKEQHFMKRSRGWIYHALRLRCSQGTGNIAQVEGTMNTGKYHQILAANITLF